jgi:hypothetical protein
MPTVRTPARAANSAASLTRLARSAPEKPGVPRAIFDGLDVFRQRHLAHVHLENLLAAADIRQPDHHLAVETARAQQRRVEHIGPVGGGDHDHAVVDLEAVHLDQQLVEGLLALVVTAAEAGATMATDGVDLVDEDDARRLLLGLVEHVAHPRRADADEHLDEIGTGDGEEGHLGLTGDGLGQQRLTGTGLADHEHAAGNAAAELLELARVAQELDQLLHVFLGLVDAGDVGEGGRDLVFAEQARLALAEAHGAAAAARAALHLAHEEHEHGDDDQDREAGDQQLRPDALLLRLTALDLDLVRQQVVDQLGILDHGPRGLEARAVEALAVDRQAVDGDLAHLVALDFLDELRVDHALRRGLHAEVVEDGQQHRGDHQPQQQIFCHVVQNSPTGFSEHGLAALPGDQVNLAGARP